MRTISIERQIPQIQIISSLSKDKKFFVQIRWIFSMAFSSRKAKDGEYNWSIFQGRFRERICLEQYLQTNDDKTMKNAETSKSLSLQYSHSLLCLNQLRNVGFSFFSTVSWLERMLKVQNKSSAIFPYFRMRLTSFNQQKNPWLSGCSTFLTYWTKNLRQKKNVPYEC